MNCLNCGSELLGGFRANATNFQLQYICQECAADDRESLLDTITRLFNKLRDGNDDRRSHHQSFAKTNKTHSPAELPRGAT